MNIKDFYKYIKQPDELNEISAKEIKEVLDRYPYFQAAHLLYLKNLHTINDDKYKSQLTVTSLYAPHRKALYNLIHHINAQNQIAEAPEIIIDKQKSEVTVEQKEIINEITEEISKPKEIVVQEKATEQIIKDIHRPEKEKIEIVETPVFDVKVVNIKNPEEKETIDLIPEKNISIPEIKPTPIIEEISVQKEPVKENLSIADQILEKIKQIQQNQKTEIPTSKPVENIPVPQEKKISKPIEEPVIKKNPEKVTPIIPEIKITPAYDVSKLSTPVKEPEEAMTFDEWLFHLTSMNDEQNKSVNKPTENKGNSIIDNFLKNAPDVRVKGNLSAPQEDLTENMTAPEDFEIISESLAQLYYKQGYFEKSLRMYEKLILKYPEKSIYFATLIQEIKNKLY
jgi:hypothetical protein